MFFNEEEELKILPDKQELMAGRYTLKWGKKWLDFDVSFRVHTNNISREPWVFVNDRTREKTYNNISNNMTRKKSPNVYKNCSKMNSQEKW